jgi:hypothetical protein
MHGHKLGNKIKIPTPSPASRPPSANRPPSGKLINIVSNEDTCYKERLTINIMVFFLK